MSMHGSQLTPGDYAARRRSERRRHTVIVAAAVVVSVLLHAVALVTVSFDTVFTRSTALPPPPHVVDIVAEMQAYDLITVSTEVPPIEVQVLERELRETEIPTLRVPAAEIPRTAAPAERITSSVRDRLRYRLGSAPEVWRPAPPARPGEFAPIESVRERIAATLGEFNDSLAAAAAAEARALDWTKEDAEGRRWGVSPGKIHLGDVTLPAPFYFRAPPGRREELANRMRDWGEIQHQVARVEGREIFDDRVKAIRERMDRQRRERIAADSARDARRLAADSARSARLPDTDR